LLIATDYDNQQEVQLPQIAYFFILVFLFLNILFIFCTNECTTPWV